MTIPTPTPVRRSPPLAPAVRHAIATLQRANLSMDARDPAIDARRSDALAVLFRAFYPMVRDAAAHALGGGPDAEDVAQTVFLRLPRAMARYRDGHFPGWLRRVATREALLSLRRTRRAEAREAAAAVATALLDATAPAPWDAHDHAEAEALADARQHMLGLAVGALPPSLREVLLLRLVVGRTHQEIAATLAISVGASYTRHCRALRSLRSLRSLTMSR